MTAGSFWDDLNERLQDPEFRQGYVEASLGIQAFDEAVNAALKQQAAGRGMGEVLASTLEIQAAVRSARKGGRGFLIRRGSGR